MDICLDKAIAVENFEFRRNGENYVILPDYKCFVETFINLKEDEKKLIHSMLSNAFINRMLSIAVRCGEEAMYTNDFYWLEIGGFCYIFDDINFDYRDRIRMAVLFVHACHKLNTTFAKTTEKARKYTDEAHIKFLDNMSLPNYYNIDLDNYGIELIHKDGRPIFAPKRISFKRT